MLQQKPLLATLAILISIVSNYSCDTKTKQNPTATNKNLSRQDSGTLFVTLGNDTTIIQSYEINGDSITTRILTIPGSVYLTEGKGTLYEDGNLKSMISKKYTVAMTGELQLKQETVLTTSNDSTFITYKRGNEITNKKNYGKCIVTNDGDMTTFFLFPFWGYYSPKKVNDSITGNQFVFGGVRKYTIKRKEENSLLVGSNIMGYLTLNLDKNDRLESIDGIGSSLNFTGIVNRHVNFDSIIKARINSQRVVGIKPKESPRDTLYFKKDDLSIAIDYSRPSVRGRKIFGAVVPWNRFWRAGANQCTEISISKPIIINKQRLEKGQYSIFIMPKPNEWTIMFNKQTGIWGTDYDPLQDVLKVPMKIEMLPNHVEQLSIIIVPSDNGGSLNIEWEKTKASVFFK